MIEPINLPINGRLVNDLIIIDSENAEAWGIQYDQSITKPFGDRDFTIESLPSVLSGSEGIRTACNSKNATRRSSRSARTRRYTSRSITE